MKTECVSEISAGDIARDGSDEVEQDASRDAPIKANARRFNMRSIFQANLYWWLLDFVNKCDSSQHGNVIIGATQVVLLRHDY